MTRWSIGFNDLHQQADYFLEEGPWWAFFVEWLSHWPCSCVPRFKFPKRYHHTEPDGERVTWREWYGNWSQWTHIRICDPIFQWANQRIVSYDISIEFEEAKKRHPKEWRWYQRLGQQ